MMQLFLGLLVSICMGLRISLLEHIPYEAATSHLLNIEIEL